MEPRVAPLIYRLQTPLAVLELALDAKAANRQKRPSDPSSLHFQQQCGSDPAGLVTRSSQAGQPGGGRGSRPAGTHRLLLVRLPDAGGWLTD